MTHSFLQVFKVKPITLTAILIIASVLVMPALAASSDNPYTFHPRIKIREGTSTNWSGYASESSIASPANGFVNKASGTWVVPTLTCGPSNTYVATWVGIDGDSDNTVEQTGTEQDCVSGVQKNYAWYEMYPHPSFSISSITVHTGDVMKASVSYIGNNRFQLTITDTTTGKSYSNTFKSNANRQSAEWIVEAPYSGGVLPLANFGTANFSNSQFTTSTGTTYAIDGRGAGTSESITMNDPNGGVSTPSGITDSGTSSSFSTTYSP